MNTTALLLTTLLAYNEYKMIGEPPTKYNGFGTDVALVGDIALIGEPGIYHDVPGKATIVTAPGGDWKKGSSSELLQPMASNHGFGWSVALGETCAMVSAPPIQTFLDEIGVVHEYKLENNVWSYSGRSILASGPGDEFGYAVAVSTDCQRVVVGAPGRGINNVEDAGAAEVYERSGGAWSLVASLTQPAQVTGNRFGRAVAIGPDGGAVVIGSYYAAKVPGRAYVFSEDDGWSDPAVLKGQTEVEDRFGYAVAISDDGTVVVGAPYEDDPMQAPGNLSGAVYVCPSVFDGDPSCTRVSISMGRNTTDALGADVAIDGDLIVAGAPHGGGGNEGALWLVVRQGQDWIEAGIRLQGQDVKNYDLFGSAVALFGSTILAGAYGADINVQKDDAGAAYVFTFDKQKGEPCGAPLDCPTGYCVDGYCCDGPCGGGDPDDCMVCDAKPGTCTIPDTDMCIGGSSSGGETDGTDTDGTTTDTAGTTTATTSDMATDTTAGSGSGGSTTNSSGGSTAAGDSTSTGATSATSASTGGADSYGCDGDCPEPSPCECNAAGDTGTGALAFAGGFLILWWRRAARR